MKRVKINKLGIDEVRWQGARKISGTFEICYSGGTEHERGVAIMLDQDMAKKSLRGYWKLSDRVLLLNIAGKSNYTAKIWSIQY